MKTREILFYMLAGLLGGCVPSLHPLYTDRELVFEEKLSDVWSDGEQIWKFEGDATEKSYELTVVDKDSKRGEFVAHLVKLDKALFLNLFPAEPELQANDFYKFHLLRIHTFLKVEQIGPILKMRAMDPGKMKDMLENDPNLIKHEIVHDDRVVLTASTKQLQQFMKKYADFEGLFGDVSNLKQLQLRDPNGHSKEIGKNKSTEESRK